MGCRWLRCSVTAEAGRSPPLLAGAPSLNLLGHRSRLERLLFRQFARCDAERVPRRRLEQGGGVPKVLNTQPLGIADHAASRIQGYYDVIEGAFREGRKARGGCAPRLKRFALRFHRRGATNAVDGPNPGDLIGVDAANEEEQKRHGPSRTPG